MQHKKTSVTVLLLLSFIANISAQLESVKYFVEPNLETNLIDCKILIEKGSATTLFHRAQLNSQYTIVVPTGSTVEIAESHNPIQNNQSYQGTEATPWIVGSKVLAPEAMPENDYYSINPQLSPTGFYNDLAAGDEVLLFSLRVSNDTSCGLADVRVFNSDRDPDSEAPGLFGGDFSNGFVLGNLLQLYEGNLTTTTPPPPSIEQSSMQNGNCTKITPHVECMSHPITYDWSTGETTPSIEVCPSTNQTYSVTLTDGAGVATVSSIDFMVTNTAQSLHLLTNTLDESTFAGIYPNPAHERVTIEAIYAIDAVTIMDLGGRVLQEVKGNNTTLQQVSLEQYESGAYLLNITAEGHRQVQRVLKL